MDKELAQYIVNYFTELLTDQEKLGLRHLSSKYKLDHAYTKDNMADMVKAYKRLGWLTEDKEILELVGKGEDELNRMVAMRILAEHGDKVFINQCPQCGRLARTPFARQCRHCAHEWR